MADNDRQPNRPSWAPTWAPSQATLAYVSTGLTALLLVGASAYLIWHLLNGGRLRVAGVTAAGVAEG